MLGGIGQKLTRLFIAHRAASERSLSAVALHSGQANILRALWEEDGMSQAGLRRKLGVSPPTVNVLVSKLSRSGLVSVRDCPDDQRVRRVYLTKKGKALREAVEDSLRELEVKMLAGFSDVEVYVAGVIMERLLDNLRSLPDSEPGS